MKQEIRLLGTRGENKRGSREASCIYARGCVCVCAVVLLTYWLIEGNVVKMELRQRVQLVAYKYVCIYVRITYVYVCMYVFMCVCGCIYACIYEMYVHGYVCVCVRCLFAYAVFD